MLPNFIIAGAPKSGTTALRDYLSQHPDIYMAEGEVRYYNQEKNYKQGLSWYEKHFLDRTNEKAVGEKTPSYMYLSDVPEKMHKDNPNVKLIFMMRNPVDRAYSDYWMGRLKGKFNFPFCEIEKHKKLFLEVGEYAEQIKRYLKYFPMEQMFFIISEEFRANRDEEMKKVLRFLEVDENFNFPDLEDKHVGIQSKSSLYTLLVDIHKKVIDTNATKRTKKVNKVVKKIFSYSNKIGKYPEMDEKTRRQLEKYFEKSNNELEKITGRDLKKWW